MSNFYYKSAALFYVIYTGFTFKLTTKFDSMPDTDSTTSPQSINRWLRKNFKKYMYYEYRAPKWFKKLTAGVVRTTLGSPAKLKLYML